MCAAEHVGISTPRKRRRFQFSLRALALLTALLALCLGYSIRLWRRHERAEVVRHMDGGIVIYEHQIAASKTFGRRCRI